MNFEVVQVPEGGRRAGMFTVLVDGAETLWYSSTEEGAYARLGELFGEDRRRGVRLRVAKAAGRRPEDAEANAGADPEGEGQRAVTREERIRAFLNRGKLGRRAEAARAFEEEHGATASVEVEGGRLVATDERGKKFDVAFNEGNVEFIARESAEKSEGE